jgi:hypothetical protein
MAFFGAITQQVLADANNSDDTPLEAGQTYTGTKSSTLGIAGIQVMLKTDTDCTVYVDQSGDGTNYDIVDEYTYHAVNGGQSWTVQAVGSDFRVRVTNNGTTTQDYFRVCTALCPIVEALPRSLSEEGNLRVGVYEIEDEGFSVRARISPIGDLRVVERVRLIGGVYAGATLDSNFWTTTPTNGGAAAVSNGELGLATNGSANGAVLVQSVRTARYVAGNANQFRAIVKPNANTGNCTKRWGAYSATSGFFFESQNGTLRLGHRVNNATPSYIENGSFDGELGDTYTLPVTTQTFEIVYTNSGARFLIGDHVIHYLSAATTPASDTLHLPVSLECINTDSNTNNNTLSVRVASVQRIGHLVAQPQSKYQSGTVAATVCKVGPGNLYRLIISTVTSGSVVTLWDNTAASGTTLWSGTITFGNQGGNGIYNIDFGGLPFATGLTLTIATQAANAVVVYE